MFLKRDKIWLFVLLLVQAVVVFVTFRSVLSPGNEFLLVNSWDGLKNYFTYYAYLMQPEGYPFFHFAQHNYPYGESILYTDNTPLLAVLIKAFSLWIYDIRPYGLLLHNIFMVGGIVLASLILFRIFRLLSTPAGIAFVASLLLPWISPQVLRLKIGHFNLSFSWVLLLVVYLLLQLFRHYPDRRKTLQFSAGLVATLVLSAFLHMYYLLLNLSLIGFFFLFWFVRDWYKKRMINGWLITLGGLNVLLPPALVMGIIRLLDDRYHLRRRVAEGYDRLDWKLNLEAFTTPYSFNKVKLKLLSFGEVPYESYLYLGSFVLVSVLVVAGLWFWLKRRGTIARAIPEDEIKVGRPFLWLFGLAALACGFIAMGEVYYFFNGSVKFTNYFNLFFYIHKFSDVVTQFRVLSRFAWVIFWFCNIAAVYWLGCVWKQYAGPFWVKVVLSGLLFLMAIDARDARKYLTQTAAPNVMSHPEHLKFMAALAGKLNPQEYQAILPVPFFHEGSEDYDLTIYPDDDFYRGAIQLSEITRLPLMGSKLSRTPPVQLQHFLSLFLKPQTDTALTNALTEKPVLVLYNSAYYHEKKGFYQDLTREPALTAYKNGENLPERKGWQLIGQQGEYRLYKAFLK
ncbi:hypothetical protein [Adhaeribacter soli]|uniref:DUF6311 domain-containing protein n=1 Tax=Adhaeribacter soli TaxID=2607655 RepID=A0A5N1IVA4_9BACT|nr:hypothetical protein [Adhaeribacter soli]KAA9331869.1 hypothetical protein F0P94_13810 [Adhaeribacter soli]